FLDKVEPHATIAEIKNLFTKTHPQWYPAHQSLHLDPKAAHGRHGHTLLPGPGGPDQLGDGLPNRVHGVLFIYLPGPESTRLWPRASILTFECSVSMLVKLYCKGDKIGIHMSNIGLPVKQVLNE
uniref:TECR-like N-terminal domain-containing protein n=1 Tax=Rhinopithecus roxellana TaxID=61622 RepID=A0A2K6PTY6_RHIRO